MSRTSKLIAATIAAVVSLPLVSPSAQTPSSGMTASSRPEVSRPASPDDVRSPMQEQAMVPNVAPITTVCGAENAVTMKDEFGRQYNCRGDRVR